MRLPRVRLTTGWRFRLWHLAALVAYLAGALGALRAMSAGEPLPPGRSLAFALFLALTPPNLLGPPWAVVQFARRGGLFAGEMLWAWLGVAWGLLIVNEPQRGTLADGLVNFSCVSLVFACLLAVFGTRPLGHPGAWGHQMGWVLLLIDISFFGFIASLYN